MGKGRNRKPRNSATFRLCPRPGAADASDRVFVRVDGNPYSVPGFADDGGPSSSDAAGGDEDPLASTAEGEDALPEHVRREILELGLPDNGYDYLAHLRELRPSLASTGGGASAVFLPSRRPARVGLPVDVKAYDLTRAPIRHGNVAETAERRVEDAIEIEVTKLLEEDNVLDFETVDEDLEEDFVILANQPDEGPDEEQQTEEHSYVFVPEDLGRDEVDGAESKEKVSEQFVLLPSERYGDGADNCPVRYVEAELSQKVAKELKLCRSENCDYDQTCRASSYFTNGTSGQSINVQIGESSNAILEFAGYAERQSNECREEEQAVLVSESGDGSAVTHCASTVSRLYFDDPGENLAQVNGQVKLPKFSPGETSMKKAIIKKGIEKLPGKH